MSLSFGINYSMEKCTRTIFTHELRSIYISENLLVRDFTDVESRTAFNHCNFRFLLMIAQGLFKSVVQYISN